MRNVPLPSPDMALTTANWLAERVTSERISMFSMPSRVSVLKSTVPITYSVSFPSPPRIISPATASCPSMPLSAVIELPNTALSAALSTFSPARTSPTNTKVSSPAPPFISSLPLPPRKMSLPAKPFRMSSPSVPLITSSPSVPVSDV